MTIINFKMSANGFDGLYQIDGRGPWRTEYKTDSMLDNGTYDVLQDGQKVGTWTQSTLGHTFDAV